MNVRIKFVSEVFIEGRDLEEVKAKFEKMDLHTKEGNGDYVEMSYVEDADTYVDLTDKWDELY